MNNSGILNINVMEQFPHLSKAPITEAVVEIRARGSVQWKETEILNKLKLKLPEYPSYRSGRAFEVQLKPEQEQKVASKDLGWQGLQFKSSDERHIAKFQQDLFSFSRLHPYGNWEQFTGEALRLWSIHFELSKHLEIQRLGVRFINRFTFSEKRIKLEDYFRAFPDDLAAMNLIRIGFIHHDTFAIPGNLYAMNVIKTVQPSDEPDNEPALILDIDTYTLQPFEPKVELIKQRLDEIHHLKNKAFFGIITKELTERYI